MKSKKIQEGQGLTGVNDTGNKFSPAKRHRRQFIAGVIDIGKQLSAGITKLRMSPKFLL
jgi:hypothetical protein